MDEAFFRQRYDADRANQAKQSWAEYRKWVLRFYEGQSFPPIAGWAQREKELVAKAPASRAAIESTGRVIAAEWAKDNSVRKVSTSDLQAWGARFKDAAKDPAKLDSALLEVESEVVKRTAASQ
jgi:hypothetical protein